MLVDFKDFYSFEDYKQLTEAELNEHKNKTENYDDIFAKQKLFEQAILNYLKERANNNMLQMPINSSTHYSNFLTAWKNLVDKKLKVDQEDKIIYTFSKIISNNMLKMTYVKTPITIEENYTNLINKVNSGDFQRFELEYDECFGCGKKIHMVTKDWKVQLQTTQIQENNKIEFKVLPDCIEDKIYEVNIEFKTGELLMADWFRIPEFTKQVDYNPEYKKLSINSDLGKIQSTEHAAELGFVTIHVGNSSPSIYQNGNDFVFGREKEDSEQNHYKEKGYICTDLWNATIIDKSRLIEIVAQKLGEEEAKKTVEKYLEEEKNNINFITVQPGKYNIAYSPNKDISNIDKELPQEMKVMFSMKKELPKKKLKM